MKKSHCRVIESGKVYHEKMRFLMVTCETIRNIMILPLDHETMIFLHSGYAYSKNEFLLMTNHYFY